jgi:hypothetical protein
MSHPSWFVVLRCAAGLCVFLLAGLAPVHAQQGRKPFIAEDAAQLLRGSGQRGVERTANGPLLKGMHCGRTSARVTPLLKGQVDVVAEDELLGLFDRILCTQAGDVAVATFGDAAADPFASGTTTYSGRLQIGEWEPELEYRDPRAEASVPYAGLMLSMPGVSLWEVTTQDRVRVWYAPFRDAPANALTFFFEYRGGRWVWTGASSSTRI